MGRIKQGRWVDNEISPSKYRSPTRYVESQSDEYGDKDDLVWDKSESDLTESQIDVYLQSTSHLPKDAALEILRDMDYNISLAMDKCNASGVISQLSHLEKKVLIAAAPIPCSSLGVKNKPALAAEKHVCSLLPHVPPPAIRNFFNNIGRDGCIPPRGWYPRVSYILEPTHARLKNAGLISVDSGSVLYKTVRVLRSSTITPELDTKLMPSKLSKRNNLAIAMVGYDQSKSGDGARTPISSPIRPLHHPIMDSRAFSVDRSPPTPSDSIDSVPIKRGRGRPPKIPYSLIPSHLRRTSPYYSQSRRPSPTPSNGSVSGRKRRDPLEIDMNWKPIDNGSARVRRPSVLMMDNPFFEKKEKVTLNGNDKPSTSRVPAGSDRNGTRESVEFTTPVRRNTRSSSVALSTESEPINPRKTRDKLHIAMVGWGQSPATSPRDRDGFAIPSLPRSPFKSPTRSRQVSPSPPASPEI